MNRPTTRTRSPAAAAIEHCNFVPTDVCTIVHDAADGRPPRLSSATVTLAVRIDDPPPAAGVCQSAALADEAVNTFPDEAVPETVTPFSFATVGPGNVPDKSPDAAPDGARESASR